MRRVAVALADRSYEILIGSGLLDGLGDACRAVGISGPLALVQDSGVATRYGPRVEASLLRADYATAVVTVPAGEGSKCLAELGRLWDAFANARLDRQSAVVALGGGVVGDLAGFAAASFLRGISFVQVPTTLLAQVDASVGGKTGIDLPAGKNLAGAFHQPLLVAADLDTLATLPARDLQSGLAEIVKYGVIADPALLDYLDLNRKAVLGHHADRMAHLVARSCEIKAGVVAQDETESGVRAILNYGHTLGHAVETVAGYGAYTHGEAVSIGMTAAGRLSNRLACLPRAEEERVEGLLLSLGLPVRLREPLPPEALVAAMHQDKKARGGRLRFVLAQTLGQVIVVDVSEAEARAAAESVQP